MQCNIHCSDNELSKLTITQHHKTWISKRVQHTVETVVRFQEFCTTPCERNSIAMPDSQPSCPDSGSSLGPLRSRCLDRAMTWSHHPMCRADTATKQQQLWNQANTIKAKLPSKSKNTATKFPQFWKKILNARTFCPTNFI